MKILSNDEVREVSAGMYHDDGGYNSISLGNWGNHYIDPSQGSFGPMDGGGRDQRSDEDRDEKHDRGTAGGGDGGHGGHRESAY